MWSLDYTKYPFVFLNNYIKPCSYAGYFYLWYRKRNVWSEDNSVILICSPATRIHFSKFFPSLTSISFLRVMSWFGSNLTLGSRWGWSRQRGGDPVMLAKWHSFCLLLICASSARLWLSTLPLLNPHDLLAWLITAFSCSIPSFLLIQHGSPPPGRADLLIHQHIQVLLSVLG